MRKILLVVFCLLTIVACYVAPSKMSQGDADNLANKITYTKDERSGLCFAVIASRKPLTFNQSGLGLSEVPCEKVEHLIKWHVKDAELYL